MWKLRVVTDQATAIVGTWKLDDEDGGMSVFIFLPSGNFILGEAPVRGTPMINHSLA